MLIRFFHAEDTGQVADVLVEMSRYYNGINASTRADIHTNLVSRILGPESCVRLVLAFEHDRVVGLAAISLLYPAPSETAQLFMKELYVVAGHRGKGVGRAMMRWLAEYALAQRCSRFDWTVDAGNVDAHRFYEDLGASVVPDKHYFRLAGDALNAFAKGD
jgi:GNAT superfamily N-acetyltransferase